MAPGTCAVLVSILFWVNAAAAAAAQMEGAVPEPTPDATHVMVRLQSENSLQEVSAALGSVKLVVAGTLCRVPDADVTAWKVLDASGRGHPGSEAVVYAACKAPNPGLSAALLSCRNGKARRSAKDVLLGVASGIELEGTDCDYVRGGKFAVLDDADSALLGYTGPGPRAPSAPASAAKAAAPAPAPTAAAPAPPAAGGSGAAAPLAVLSAGAAALLACLLP